MTAKRRKKSVGARLRPFGWLIVPIAIALGFAAYGAATWPGFFPKRIVVSGNHIVPSSLIVRRADITTHDNVWLQNLRAAASRVESIPYIKSAAIHRTPPAVVRIAVVERTPFAVVVSKGVRAVVDRDLRVLQTGTGGSGLPVIAVRSRVPAAGAFLRDAQAQRLRDDDILLTRAGIAARALRFDRFGDLIATTRGGTELLLGDDADLAKKTPLVDPIISQVRAEGRKVAAVDLRAPHTPVVVYKR